MVFIWKKGTHHNDASSTEKEFPIIPQENKKLIEDVLLLGNTVAACTKRYYELCESIPFESLLQAKSELERTKRILLKLLKNR